MRRLLALVTIITTVTTGCAAAEDTEGSAGQAAERPSASDRPAEPKDKATDRPKPADTTTAPDEDPPSQAEPSEPATSKPATPKLESPERTTPPGVPAAAQAAVVASITDGDTLHLRAVRPGRTLRSTNDVTVRLLEIDTPETVDPSKPVQCFGPQATAALTRLAPPGSRVYVLADQELIDPYDRTLLYLWSVDDGGGRFVNKALVHGGWAKAALYEPNDLYIDAMRSAERGARAADRGLWGACSRFGAPLNPPEPESEPEPEPAPSGGGSGGGNCDPSYSGACIPPYPPDLDCTEVDAQGFNVESDDPHGFDADGDGIACDT